MQNASSDGMARKAPLDDAETSLGDSGGTINSDKPHSSET